MKVSFKVLGFIALAAIIGFAFFACDDEDGSSSLSGTVSITGNAEVGETLTADTEALGGKGTISYQWRRGSTTIGSNSNTYVVQNADVGSVIRVTVTRSGNSGSCQSDETTVVAPRGMVWVSAGSFEMGKHLGTGEGTDVTPVST